jgi:outer membrane protein OmpA-like peptidoglycan-associated protein
MSATSMMKRRAGMVLALAAAGLALVACAGPNQTVERAELATRDVRNDGDIQRYAPVAIDRTEEALRRLQVAQTNVESQAELEHLAYLVEQRARIARLRADTVGNREAIDRLGLRRQQVLIDAESLETRAAEQEAASALRDAQVASARADALQQELEDLEARQTDRGLLVTIGDVLFDVDGAQLKPGGLEQVSRIAETLRGNPGRSVVIEGHTDSTGPEGYNLKLSEERADAVRAALIAEGVSPEKISARGYGEAYPVATNDEQSGRQQNRRVELIIQES